MSKTGGWQRKFKTTEPVLFWDVWVDRPERVDITSEKSLRHLFIFGLHIIGT